MMLITYESEWPYVDHVFFSLHRGFRRKSLGKCTNISNSRQDFEHTIELYHFRRCAHANERLVKAEEAMYEFAIRHFWLLQFFLCGGFCFRVACISGIRLPLCGFLAVQA